MRNKMTPKNKSLLGNFVNKFCQFVKIFCQDILSRNFVNTFCQQSLPTHFLKTICQQIFQQIISSAFVIAFNVNNLSIFCVNQFCQQFCQSILSTLVSLFYSRVWKVPLMRNKMTPKNKSLICNMIFWNWGMLMLN